MMLNRKATQLTLLHSRCNTISAILDMAFPYQHVLLIGATSGIGRAMADRFIAEGVRVTAVGRRQERLDDFVSSHGSDKASSLTFDIGELERIPTFVET